MGFNHKEGVVGGVESFQSGVAKVSCGEECEIMYTKCCRVPIFVFVGASLLGVH